MPAVQIKQVMLILMKMDFANPIKLKSGFLIKNHPQIYLKNFKNFVMKRQRRIIVNVKI